MLRNPRTTIVPLPLYFYIPNFGGIVLSAKQLRIMQSLCTGIRTAFLKYQKSATPHQMKKWSENFQWYFINWAFRKLKYVESNDERVAAQECFRELERIGALDRPPFKWAKKLRVQICDFIKSQQGFRINSPHKHSDIDERARLFHPPRTIRTLHQNVL